MSNGKIEYSLGLSTGGFLGPLNVSRVALAGFAAAAAAGGGLIAGVMSEINRGGALKDLSNRTAESVRDLFQLQFAFEQSGIAAGNVAPILHKYRASLSGIGEMGENTAEAFSLIGVSIDDLKKMDAPQALQAIFGGLAKLDRNTAAGAASKIFGRGSSGDILQLARDAGDFAGSLKEAAAQAAQMDRMAGVFDSIGDRLGDIKLQIRGVFLNLASDVGPALNGILTTLAAKDFATLGKIAELSLTVAFEKSVNFLANTLTKLFTTLPGIFIAAFKVSIAAMAGIASKNLGGMLSALKILSPGAALAGAVLGRDKESQLIKDGAAVLNEVATTGMKEAGQDLVESVKAGAAAGGIDLFGDANATELAKLLERFGPGAGAIQAPGVGDMTATNLLATNGKGLGEANALERIGANFGGGDGGTQQVQREQLLVLGRIWKTNVQLKEEVQRMNRQFTVENI